MIRALHTGRSPWVQALIEPARFLLPHSRFRTGIKELHILGMNRPACGLVLLQDPVFWTIYRERAGRGLQHVRRCEPVRERLWQCWW